MSTGRGTEGFILDSDAGQMCRNAIPLFQRGDYSGAMAYLASTVAGEFAREFAVTGRELACDFGRDP